MATGDISTMQAAYMLGRCANGNEADKGRLYHAVGSWVALCGREPGRRSAGWALYKDQTRPLSEVNCPRCKSKLVRAAQVQA